MTAPLRVLVAHNHYRSSQPSGEDQVVAREVAALRAAGHDVATFDRYSDDLEGMSGLGRARVIAEVPGSRRAAADFRAAVRQFRPDVVHLHNTFPMVTASVITAATDLGVPVVATLHQYRLICHSGTLYRDGRICDDCVGRAGLPGIRHGCYRGSVAATVPMAVAMLANRRRWRTGVERFFCISAAQRDTLVRAGLPADRLTVKHNFVPEPAHRRTGPGSYLLYLGRLTEEKGVRLLMAAWDRLAAAGGVGVPLRIAGSGDLAAEVAAWVRGREDVEYLGLCDRARCEQLAAGARAVVVPSVWPETFGLVVVEAMAAGVPVVAAAHGAFVELIEENVSGLLHEPGDVASLSDALGVIADPDRALRMGTAARTRYESAFTTEIGVARLVEGYRAAMAGRARVAA
jgi:glycosyltransferase involved in cell wall biosynthesis